MSGHFSNDSLQLRFNLWGEFKPGYHTLFGVARTPCYIKVQINCQSAATICVSSWSTNSTRNEQIPYLTFYDCSFTETTHTSGNRPQCDVTKGGWFLQGCQHSWGKRKKQSRCRSRKLPGSAVAGGRKLKANLVIHFLASVDKRFLD